MWSTTGIRFDQRRRGARIAWLAILLLALAPACASTKGTGAQAASSRLRGPADSPARVASPRSPAVATQPAGQGGEKGAVCSSSASSVASCRASC